MPLPNSLFTRAQTSLEPEERKSEEPLCKCSHKSNVARNLERKVTGSNLDEDFSILSLRSSQ